VRFKARNLTVLIINTRVRHMHAETGYAERRSQCIDAARE
jgi:galactokinase